MFDRSVGVNGYYLLPMMRWFFALAILSLIGCTGDSGNTDYPRKVAMAINPDTPLAGQLTVTTEVPTRISLDISDGINNWTIDFTDNDYDYATSHTLPILGFRPNRTHTIVVRATDSAGNSVPVDQPPPIITAALPVGFPNITVESDPTMMEPGFTLFSLLPQRASTQLDPMLVIVDQNGEVVWYHSGSRFFDFRQLPNGNLIFMEGLKIVEMDMLGNRIQEWSSITDSSNVPIPDANRFHHELYPMNNGHFLVVSAEARSYINYPSNEIPSLAESEPTAQVVGDVIVEFDANGQLVNRWNLLDILDPYRLGYGSLGIYWNPTFGDSRDWSHTNAVIYDETDDAIIISVRHQDAIVKFSRTTDTAAGTVSGEIKWILAPHDNWVSPYDKYLLNPVNDYPNFYTYHQHAPMLLPNGNIMVYDNGSFRQSPNIDVTVYPDAVSFSRAVEYQIDESTMDVNLVWQYGPESSVDPAWNYSGALGDADLLPQTGNVLIVHGSMAVDYTDDVGPYVKQWARIVEVTRHLTGEPEKEVFNMVVEDLDTTQATGWRIYRSDRISSFY